MTRCISLLLLSFSFTFLNTSAQIQKVKHVIFIGVDGMGAYAVNRSENTTMRMMMKQGAYSLKALSSMPSSSAPNWASHLTGVPPTEHGFTKWNSRTPDFVSPKQNEFGMYSTIFFALKKQKPQLTSAVVYQWEGIPFLYERTCVIKELKGGDDVATTNAAKQVIENLKPNLLFIQLNSPDSAGHTIGFNSPEFFEKVKKVDTYISDIVAATKKAGIYNNTVFLISADHGGKGKEHGEDTPLEREIPWILYGKPVKKKGLIKRAIMVYDSAPTLAWLLHIKPLKEWSGKAIKDAF
jgi:predicted AlkP superfamily pyrophosphatase or phosphodiesterase